MQISEVTQAIHQVQLEIRWKFGSAERHLQKRIARKHLSQEATLDDYETIIRQVVFDTLAQVYIFWYDEVPYISVISVIEERYWLVMFAENGLLESAYIVERPERYLQKSHVQFIGRLGELYHEL